MDPKSKSPSIKEETPEETDDFERVFGKSTKDHKEAWVRSMGRENTAIMNIKMTCLKDLLGHLHGESQCKRDNHCFAPLHICTKFFHKPGEEVQGALNILLAEMANLNSKTCPSEEVIHQDEKGTWVVHIPPYCSSLLNTTACRHPKDKCPYAQFGLKYVLEKMHEVKMQKERALEEYRALKEGRLERPIG